MMESVRPYEQAVSGLAPGLRGRLLTLPHSVVAQAQELRLLLGQPPILRAIATGANAIEIWLQ